MKQWFLSSGPELGPIASTVLLALRWLLALAFLAFAAKNLSGDETMVADFRRWGYSDGFRLLTAFLQIAGALLLVLPRLSFAGALLLTCILLGAVVTHWRFDPPKALLAPVVFLLPTMALLWMHRPPALR